MEKTLVILAAGMGSRFGGLKQIEPVGPNGEIIADYSVYDAIRAGFTKVVFIIRKEHLEYFKENITVKYKDKIKVEFALQELDNVKATIPKERVKMLGTGHALLCAKDIVKEPFSMINSDDFYGSGAYVIASNFLENSQDDLEYLTVNYPFIQTASKNGKVNRGVCFEENGYIKDIKECSIYLDNDQIIAETHTGEEKFNIDSSAPVSMNFFGLKPSIFTILEKDFSAFCRDGITEKNEFLIPAVLNAHIKDKSIKLKSEISNSTWLGVTYKDDLENFKTEIKKLIEEGEYPDNLWG